MMICTETAESQSSSSRPVGCYRRRVWRLDEITGVVEGASFFCADAHMRVWVWTDWADMSSWTIPWSRARVAYLGRNSAPCDADAWRSLVRSVGTNNAKCLILQSDAGTASIFPTRFVHIAYARYDPELYSPNEENQINKGIIGYNYVTLM